jgi:hypothetical protein
MSLLSLLSNIKTMMDRDELFIPVEDRNLILPADCEPMFFTDDKFMSNNYVQLQMNNISEGRIGRILGFNIIFINEMKSGGLKYDTIDGGANRIWTCYATSNVCVASAVGYGADRTAGGSGGIFKLQEMANEGGYFINAPFCYGASVVLPNGVIRFTLKTPNL